MIWWFYWHSEQFFMHSGDVCVWFCNGIVSGDEQLIRPIQIECKSLLTLWWFLQIESIYLRIWHLETRPASECDRKNRSAFNQNKPNLSILLNTRIDRTSVPWNRPNIQITVYEFLVMLDGEIVCVIDSETIDDQICADSIKFHLTTPSIGWLSNNCVNIIYLSWLNNRIWKSNLPTRMHTNWNASNTIRTIQI